MTTITNADINALLADAALASKARTGFSALASLITLSRVTLTARGTCLANNHGAAHA